MKNTIITAIIILTFMSCKAQQPIIALYQGSEYGETPNAYYKDTGNDFNKYVGTWKYTNGNEKFEIKFRKISQRPVNIDFPTSISFYEDILIGDYKYTNSSDAVLVNTLANIDNSALTIFDHLTFGNFFVAPKYPPICDGCGPNEKRVILSFEDPGREYLNYKIIIRYVLTPFLDSNGNQIETIELQLTNETSIIPLGESAESRIPYGKYILIKQ